MAYTFDANGNLLDDGVNTYTYDPANRLSTVDGPSSAVYVYNGLGDRLQQTVDEETTTYVLDLAAGLTQVLDDGTNSYLYGNGRIAQVNTGTEYFLGDALGSVRQMTDGSGVVKLARAYDPYGVTRQNDATRQTMYGFTSEQTDSATGLIYLRARHYSPSNSRFMSRDTWGGNANQPMSYNRWNYTNANPVNLTDPTGMRPEDSGYCSSIAGSSSYLQCEKIVRGLDPRSAFSLHDIEMYDATGSRPDCPLYLILDLPGTRLDSHNLIKTSEDYGFWFHYMLDKAPGWWNLGGRVHASFIAVAALAISNELGSNSLRNTIMPMAAEAFVRKGWTDGFYAMIGSRTIVRNAVDDALFFPRACDGCQSDTRLKDRNDAEGDGSFADALSRFVSGARGVGQFDMNGGLAGTMDAALANPSFHNDGGGNSPYEWGNPTTWTNDHYGGECQELCVNGLNFNNIFCRQSEWRVG